MKLAFEYRFEIEFAKPVFNHFYSIRALPHTSQIVEDLTLNLKNVGSYIDGFGNKTLFGEILELHDRFDYSCSGVISLPTPIDTDDTHLGVFLQSTPLTPFCNELKKYDEKLKLHGLTSEQKASFVVSFIFEHFKYECGLTDSNSDIRDVILYEKGVCQDFAHLMATIMRLEGVPSRYVSGLCDGEGETHAWVECFIDGAWVGFDPTHNTKCERGAYIKLSHGRDYADCAPNNGVFKGQNSFQYLQAYTKATRIDA